MKLGTVRELAEREVGNSDTSALPPGTIGLEGDKAWSACFDAFMRLFGNALLVQDDACKTCGGDGAIDGESGLPVPEALKRVAEDGGAFIRTTCPACHGEQPKALVVDPGRWEAAEQILASAMGYFADDDDTSAQEWLDDWMRQLALALLGQPLLVAREVFENVGQMDIECWPSENEPVCYNRQWDEEPMGRIALLEENKL